jgi:hypothetical protein
MSSLDEVDVEPHRDAVASHHRFPPIVFRGAVWDLSQLDPFAFRADVGREGTPVLADVIVFFACHCFTKGEAGVRAAASEYYRDGRETRVLCGERYELSRRFLPHIVKELFSRKIRVASYRLNYITVEVIDGSAPGLYAVFFEVEKDRNRKKRLLLRVQSAYRVVSASRHMRARGHPIGVRTPGFDGDVRRLATMPSTSYHLPRFALCSYSGLRPVVSP